MNLMKSLVIYPFNLFFFGQHINLKQFLLSPQNKACVNRVSATSTTSLWMDTRSASASPSVVASPSSLWRLAERRNRKSGSGNIFSTVSLWQLQRLFRAAGDEDAEQRAQLVWGHRDEAELAQALVALQSRGHRRALRTNGRDAMGSHWLRAFNNLRYNHPHIREVLI